MGNASKYLVGKLNYEKTFVLFCSEGLSRKKKKEKLEQFDLYTLSCPGDSPRTIKMKP